MADEREVEAVIAEMRDMADFTLNSWADRLDAARSTRPACSTCHGGGEVVERGHSLNPYTGTLVPDPQCDVSHVCPDCDGTGERAA